MRDVENEIFSSLNDLCNAYEMYIWRNNNSKLDVLIHDNSISLYLYDDGEVIDEIIINFLSNNNETKLYRYMGIRLLLIFLGKVIMHRNDNVIYNDSHKPYLRFIVNDDKMLELIDRIIGRQHQEFINKNMDIIMNMYRNISFGRPLYKFSDELYDRVDISKSMLRCRKK